MTAASSRVVALFFAGRIGATAAIHAGLTREAIRTFLEWHGRLTFWDCEMRPVAVGRTSTGAPTKRLRWQPSGFGPQFGSR